jgi:hypothetical protein
MKNMTVNAIANKQHEDLFFSFLLLPSQAGKIYMHITVDQLTIFLEGLFLTVSLHFSPQHRHGL